MNKNKERYLTQIQAGVDYIEARLGQDVALSSVAAHANLSQWHFQKIFKALTNETLKTYIRSRRMANALDRLLVSSDKILDIAVDTGYDTHESFTRAFTATFGMSPGSYRKLGDKSLFLKKPQFDTQYLEHIAGNRNLQPEIHEQTAMKLVGMHTRFYGADSGKNNMADKLPKLWTTFLAHLGEVKATVGSNCYGVISVIDQGGDQLDYYAAIEVDSVQGIPQGMVELEVPAATYARFSHHGEVKKVDSTVNYIYGNWLMQSGMKHSYGPDVETYGPDYDAESADSVMHYSIPVTGPA